jgi:hypothetical protein
MTKVTFSTNFETRNYPFGSGEGSLRSGAVSTWDMTLKTMARFNTYDEMCSGYIGARR